MLKCAGRFIFYTMSNRVPFQKPYTNPHDLVLQLQQRGLSVTDTVKAERYIEYIGYYRLSAYMYPLLQMPKELHRYKPNTSFDQVMMLYRFDKKLRLLIFNEIEKINKLPSVEKLIYISFPFSTKFMLYDYQGNSMVDR